jgi:hypothetical protein
MGIKHNGVMPQRLWTRLIKLGTRKINSGGRWHTGSCKTHIAVSVMKLIVDTVDTETGCHGGHISFHTYNTSVDPMVKRKTSTETDCHVGHRNECLCLIH